MANKGLLIFLVLLVTGIITTVVVLMMKKPKSKDCGKFIKNDDGTCSTTACLTGYKLDDTACVVDTGDGNGDDDGNGNGDGGDPDPDGDGNGDGDAGGKCTGVVPSLCSRYKKADDCNMYSMFGCYWE